MSLCSFCKQPKRSGGVLIRGQPKPQGPVVHICDLCVAQAQGPMATIAYCAGCNATNGKHEPDCKEAKETA